MWNSSSDINELETQVNSCLVTVQEYTSKHKLNFNASKSSNCFFTTKKNLYNYSPELFLKIERLYRNKYPSHLGFPLNPEVNCSKRIEKLADEARKILRILIYISGIDWKFNASTLRIAYTIMVRPVLEYGYQIDQMASPANLKKLKRVHLNAARIITRLRNSCPNNVVLYEGGHPASGGDLK